MDFVLNLAFGNAATVVLHFQNEMFRRFDQAHFDFAGVGMADDVGERLLENTEESRVQVLIQNGIVDGHVHMALDAGLLLEFIGLPLQGSGQPGGIQQPGPQFCHDAADGLDRFVNAVGHRVNLAMKRFQILGKHAASHVS